MAIFAVWHVGIGNKRYKPGERLPEVDDATWKRLAEAGAIRTVYEENPPTSADFDTQATAGAGDHGDPVGPKGEPGRPILTEDEEDDGRRNCRRRTACQVCEEKEGARVSLAERLKEDVTHIFFRESEFARRHSFNGTEILCIVDGEDRQKNKNMNAISIEWDAGVHLITLRVPDGQLADTPLEGEMITFDGRLYAVIQVTDNEGEWIIELRSSEARTIL